MRRPSLFGWAISAVVVTAAIADEPAVQPLSNTTTPADSVASRVRSLAADLEKSGPERREAADALVRIGPPAIPILAESLQTAGIESRNAIIDVLKRMLQSTDPATAASTEASIRRIARFGETRPARLCVLLLQKQQSRAAARIAKLGARLQRDDQWPGAPLVAVDFTWAKATDKSLTDLKHLTRLTRLRLSAPPLTDDGLANLSELTNLKELRLQGAKFTDRGLAHLKSTPDLEILRLKSTSVTNDGLAHLKHLQKCRELCLADAKIGDAGLAHLADLIELQDLDLSGTQVTDGGLLHLQNLKNLVRLKLDRTKVTDAGLAHLQGLSKLELVWTAETRITDAGKLAMTKALPAVEFNVEEKLREMLFRQLIQEENARHTVFFLGFIAGPEDVTARDVSDELLKRLADLNVTLKKRSQYPADEVFHPNGETISTVGDFEWIGPTKARVNISNWRGKLDAIGSNVTVEKQGREWKITLTGFWIS